MRRAVARDRSATAAASDSVIVGRSLAEGAEHREPLASVVMNSLVVASRLRASIAGAWALAVTSPLTPHGSLTDNGR